MVITSFKDLAVWQKGMVLVKDIYFLTGHLPKEEKFGLCSQMQRAAVSIPSNIAEGHSQYSRKDFKHFISIALGSLAELETQLILCTNIGYFSEQQLEQVFQQIEALGKMLNGLRVKLENKENFSRSKPLNPNPHLSEIKYGLQ